MDHVDQGVGRTGLHHPRLVHEALVAVGGDQVPEDIGGAPRPREVVALEVVLVVGRRGVPVVYLGHVLVPREAARRVGPRQHAAGAVEGERRSPLDRHRGGPLGLPRIPRRLPPLLLLPVLGLDLVVLSDPPQPHHELVLGQALQGVEHRVVGVLLPRVVRVRLLPPKVDGGPVVRPGGVLGAVKAPEVELPALRPRDVPALGAVPDVSLPPPRPPVLRHPDEVAALRLGARAGLLPLQHRGRGRGRPLQGRRFRNLGRPPGALAGRALLPSGDDGLGGGRLVPSRWRILRPSLARAGHAVDQMTSSSSSSWGHLQLRARSNPILVRNRTKAKAKIDASPSPSTSCPPDRARNDFEDGT
mmetsp:Transcript_759/g.2224  ORF Transcript_759/g.2224 Transcript_759/m.2224 type:complete len:359 (-) Transcript_759:142-1218(-)